MEITLALKKAKLPENLEGEIAKKLNHLRLVADFQENETNEQLQTQIMSVCTQTVQKVCDLHSSAKLSMRKLLEENVS